MPTLRPRTIAYDGRTYLYATRGKDKLIFALDGAMRLELVRKVTAPSDTMWVAGNRAVFWAIDKTVVVALDDANAKNKTLKHATFSLEAAFIGAPPGLFATDEHDVYRFDGERWAAATGQGTVVIATLGGARARAIDGGTWTTIAAYKAVRASISASQQRCLVGLHGATSIVVGSDGSDPRDVTVRDTIWCSAGCDDGFFAWSGYRVWHVGFDGKAKDTGITHDVEAPDSCLVRAGDAVYFVMDDALWRYRAGEWKRHVPRA